MWTRVVVINDNGQCTVIARRLTIIVTGQPPIQNKHLSSCCIAKLARGGQVGVHTVLYTSVMCNANFYLNRPNLNLISVFVRGYPLV